MQSWGEHSHFNQRDTARFPTRSGVIGILAAAHGRHRHHAIDDLTHLSLTVRIDRPGVLLRDLHTVGGGLPAKATVTTTEGKKRGGKTSTLLSHRYYLADAAFTIALTSPEKDNRLLNQCALALRAPHWPLYLGRRSCPPEGPLLIGQSNDALHHLLHLPLATHQPPTGARTIEFLSDQPLDRLPLPAHAENTHDAEHPSSEVNDDPLTFHPSKRAYRARPLYRRTTRLDNTPHAGLGATYLKALDAYLATHSLTLEGSRC